MSDFTPTEWTTSAEKERFVAQYKRFVTTGFPVSRFTVSFYRRLSNCFGHIAHYDRGGFYDTWFTSTPKKLAFLQNALEYLCYGSPAFTFSDVERHLQEWLRTEHLVEIYQERVEADTERGERAELKRLTAKYEAQGQ